MKPSWILAILLSMVGMGFGQDLVIQDDDTTGTLHEPATKLSDLTTQTFPGNFTFADICMESQEIRLQSGTVLAQCVDGKWRAGESTHIISDPEGKANSYVPKWEAVVDVPAIQETTCYDELQPLTKEQMAKIEQRPVGKASAQACGEGFSCTKGEFTTYECPAGYALFNDWQGILASSIPDGEATIVDHWDKGPNPNKRELCQNIAQVKALKRMTKHECVKTGKPSCADPNRVLLTSVNGKHHVCHLLGDLIQEGK